MKFEDLKKKYEGPYDVRDMDMYNDMLFLIRYVQLLHEHINLEQEAQELKEVVHEIQDCTWH